MTDTRVTIRGDNKTARAFSQVNSNLDALQRTVLRVNAAAFTFTRLLGGAALATAAKQTIDFANEVQNLSTRLGGSTEFFSELQFIARKTGVDFGTATTAVQRLTRRLGEAAAGTGDARVAFRALNIDAERLSKLPLETQFAVVAEQLSKVEDASERAALASKILDTEGVELLQTFEDGAAGLDKYAGEARQLGLVLSQETTDAAVAADSAIADFQGTLTGIARELILNSLPALTETANTIQTKLPQAINIGTTAFKVLETGFRTAIAAITGALSGLVQGVAFVARFLGRGQIAGGLEAASDALADFAFDALDGAAASAELARESFKVGIGLKDITANANETADAVNRVNEALQGGAVRSGPLTGLKTAGEEDTNEREDAAAQRKAKREQEAAEKSAKRAADALQSELDRNEQAFAGTIEGAITAGAQDGAKGLVAALVNSLQSTAIGALSSGIASLFGSRTEGGGGGLFGFATGGQFLVGGGGGQDSSLVAFRATPGETVTVTRPDQQLGGGGQFVFNVDARGATDPAQTQRAIEQAVLRSEKRILDLQQRGRFGA